MIEFDCEEVKRQLNRLATALPDDQVNIWLCWEKNVLTFTGYVHARDGLPNLCSHNDNVVAGVDDILKQAGPRDSQGVFRAKREAVEKMRAELAKLESELDPLVMAVDKAQADAATPPTI